MHDKVGQGAKHQDLRRKTGDLACRVGHRKQGQKVTDGE